MIPPLIWKDITCCHCTRYRYIFTPYEVFHVENIHVSTRIYIFIFLLCLNAGARQRTSTMVFCVTITSILCTLDIYRSTSILCTFDLVLYSYTFQYCRYSFTDFKLCFFLSVKLCAQIFSIMIRLIRYYYVRNRYHVLILRWSMNHSNINIK